MSFLYPWVLTIAALIISLLLNRGCRGLNLPPLPWRLPWILLLLWTLEQSIQKLEIPISNRDQFQHCQPSHCINRNQPGLDLADFRADAQVQNSAQ